MFPISITGNNSFSAIILGLPFALLGALQIAPYLVTRAQSELGRQRIAVARQLGNDALGTLPPGWVLVSAEQTERERDSPQGRYSKIYQLTDTASQRPAQFSVDFPFIGGWHELTECYTNSGWTCSSEVFSIEQHDERWPYVQTRMRDSEGREALLLFSLFDETGRGLTPPLGDAAYTFWQRFNKTDLIKLTESRLPTCFQLQLFVINPPPDSAEEAKLLDLFQTIRERIRSQVASQQPHP